MQPARVTTTSAAAAYRRPSVISAIATIRWVSARRMRESISMRSSGAGNSKTAMSGTGLVSENNRIERTNGPGAKGPSTTMRIGTAKPLSASRGSSRRKRS